jgi:hypothetical protein
VSCGAEPSRRGQRGPYLVGSQARTVRRRIGLEATSFGQRPGVDDIEAERVDQLGDHLLGLGVVAGERQRAPVVGAGRLPLAAQLAGLDRVENFDDPRRGQMRGEQLAAGGLPGVELGDVAVARRVVVVGVHHDLAGERLDRQVAVCPHRDRHEDDVRGAGGVAHRGCRGLRAESSYQVAEGFGPA